MRIKKHDMEGRACWHKSEPEDRWVHEEAHEQSFSRYLTFFLRFSTFPFVRLPFCTSQLSDFLIWSRLLLANIQDVARNDLPSHLSTLESSNSIGGWWCQRGRREEWRKGTRRRMKFVVPEVCYRLSVNLSFPFVLFLLCWVAFAFGTQCWSHSQGSLFFHCCCLRLQLFAISFPVLNDSTAVESFALFGLLGLLAPKASFLCKTLHCILERLTDLSKDLSFLPRDENWRWREQNRECLGWLETRRCGWRTIKHIWLRCIQASQVSILCFICALHSPRFHPLHTYSLLICFTDAFLNYLQLSLQPC